MYSNGPSICSGCCCSSAVLSCYACWLFSVFPSAYFSCACVYIFFYHLLSCCRPQFLSLFVAASFAPPVRTHVTETHGELFDIAVRACLRLAYVLWVSLPSSVNLFYQLYSNPISARYISHLISQISQIVEPKFPLS